MLVVSSQYIKTTALLNYSQGDMGLPGPNGTPSDPIQIVMPTTIVISPPMYKVKGLRRNRLYSQLNLKKERKRQGKKINFFNFIQTVALEEEKSSSSNYAWKHNYSFSQITASAHHLKQLWWIWNNMRQQHDPTSWNNMIHFKKISNLALSMWVSGTDYVQSTVQTQCMELSDKML